MYNKLDRYYYDDFAEVREEIAFRIRNKISALLRALAKRTSNMLSGKLSKWLLECASSVSRGKIEKAKIKLTKIQIFVKRNKVKIGVAAVAIASALTTIGVLLHNRALLKRKAREAAEALSNKMKEGLSAIIRKSKNAFARENKEKGGRPSQRGKESLKSYGKQLGLAGVAEKNFRSNVVEANQAFARKRLEVLEALRLARVPNQGPGDIKAMGERVEKIMKEVNKMKAKSPSMAGAFNSNVDVVLSSCDNALREIKKRYKESQELYEEQRGYKNEKDLAEYFKKTKQGIYAEKYNGDPKYEKQRKEYEERLMKRGKNAGLF